MSCEIEVGWWFYWGQVKSKEKGKGKYVGGLRVTHVYIITMSQNFFFFNLFNVNQLYQYDE